MTCRGAILAALALPFSLTAIGAPCLSYDKPATLTGKVAIKTFFGPPNFGENPETDARETQAILLPAKPVCVNGNDEYDLEKNQTEVTLVPPRGVNWKAFAGKQVTVHGSLFHADNGHHHTTILMQVARVGQVRK